MIEFGSVTNIPGNTQVTVLTFINTDKIRYLRQVGVTGNNNGLWKVYINMQEVVSRRTTGVDMSFDFDMFSELIQVGDIIDIKVTHFRTFLSDFSSEIIITDTKDEDITTNLIVPLHGSINIQNILKGALSETKNLTGNIHVLNKLTGTIISKNELIGTATIKNKLNGVLSCG